MKKSITTTAILAAGLFVAVMVTSCNSKKTEQNQEAGAKMDSTATVYACPMHPEVTRKDGDKCAKCGMKLTAVKAKDSTAMQHK